MLKLATPSDGGWLDEALGRLDELMVDHAHCEKKAAGNAVQLIFRYPHQTFLHVPLSKLAREELEHFERILALLGTRGLALRPQRPSDYAGKLRRLTRSRDPELLVDLLLVSALIEARSCERFQLLAEACPDAELAALYRELFACEARHHRRYVELAEQAGPPAEVQARLEELAQGEAEILASLPRMARMHGGA